MLPTARRFLRRLCDTLGPHVREGSFIVGVEPSCVAVFRDELVSMLPHDEDAKRIAQHTLTLAEFLQRHAADWDVARLERRALVHGHCHHYGSCSVAAAPARALTRAVQTPRRAGNADEVAGHTEAPQLRRRDPLEHEVGARRQLRCDERNP